jgi:hypothetical protein
MATPAPVQPVASTSSVKAVTHVVAAILAAGAAFLVTPAGQALVHQYPKLSVVSGLVFTLASLYHDPKAD